MPPGTGSKPRAGSRPCLSAVCAAALLAWQPAAATELDITGTSIEALMQLTVTSVTKTEQSLQGSAAAIHVITSDDLRRMRVTNIPDALRLVPGVQVKRFNSSTWSVSIRGFNNVFANKLLVLIDGRTVYTPVFAGTLWEIREPMLEDIDRIEVIRGPGGSLWGSNAVNGVINIITRKAGDTRGGLVAAGVGNEDRAYGAIRHGWQTGDDAWLRAYAKFHERGAQPDPAHRSDNEWRSARGGFRWDWKQNDQDQYTVQGDMYEVNTDHYSTLANIAGGGATIRPRYLGGNLLLRWQNRRIDGSGKTLQFYWDYQDNDFPLIAEDRRHIADIEYQHDFFAGDRHHLVWGIGYRFVKDRVMTETGFLPFAPVQSEDGTWSAFIQDEIELLRDRLHLTVGTKYERNNFTQDEIQPNLRLSWTPSDRHTLWGAVSRAVRTPSRFEDDITTFAGNDLRSERLVAWEVGHRANLGSELHVDSAAFYNRYDDLLFQETLACIPLAPPMFGGCPAATPLGIVFDNSAKGHTWGMEFNALWQPTANWTLEPSFTFLVMKLESKNGHAARTAAAGAERADPRHRFTLRSGYELTETLNMDTILRYSDNSSAGMVDSYTTLDLGVTWTPVPDLELALEGRDLLDNRHPESSGAGLLNLTEPTEVQSGVYGKITWKF